MRVVLSIVHPLGATGTALSNLKSGYLVDSTNYETGFTFFLFPTFIRLYFIFGTRVQSLEALVATPIKTDEVEEMMIFFHTCKLLNHRMNDFTLFYTLP